MKSLNFSSKKLLGYVIKNAKLGAYFKEYKETVNKDIDSFDVIYTDKENAHFYKTLVEAEQDLTWLVNRSIELSFNGAKALDYKVFKIEEVYA